MVDFVNTIEDEEVMPADVNEEFEDHIIDGDCVEKRTSTTVLNGTEIPIQQANERRTSTTTKCLSHY